MQGTCKVNKQKEARENEIGPRDDQAEISKQESSSQGITFIDLCITTIYHYKYMCVKHN